MSDLPFGPYVIVSCQLTYDPKVVQLSGPLGIGLTVPYDAYQQVREALGLPELICPQVEV